MERKKTIAYFVSGLSANEKVFSHIKLPETFEKKFISWKLPYPGESLSSYSQRMAEEINQKEPFILIGLSFGGVIVQEMNQFVNPKQTIIISSIKSRVEMPALFCFSARTKLYKLVPVRVLFLYHKLLISNSSGKNKRYLGYFFTYLDPHYIRWSIEKIVHWHSTVTVDNLYHIHGEKDIIFPSKNLKGKIYLISNGTHAIILQRAKSINKILQCILIHRDH